MIQINQKTDKRLFMQSSLCALSALFGLSAVYADDYPNRPIKLVVPFPPGGSTDVTGRAIGTKLALRLNQAGVIENKPGGNATIGARAVLNSSADGYTLFQEGGKRGKKRKGKKIEKKKRKKRGKKGDEE